MGFERIDCADATFVFDLREAARPTILYCGARLRPDADLAGLAVLLAEGPRPSTPDVAPSVTLFPTVEGGFLGAPALRLGASRVCALLLSSVERGPGFLALELRDPLAGVLIRQEWRVHASLIGVSTRLTNLGDGTLDLSWLAALTLPLPVWADQHWTFAGRWAGEFQATACPVGPGVHERVSRGGRPGFENAGFAVLAERDSGDFHGQALALHLAWSGNSRTLIETTGFGLRQVQIGEALEEGEVRLLPGAHYDAPEVLVVASQAGFDGVRQAFHAHARAVGAPLRGPRRVHFNSWEAAYFDFDLQRLFALATAAADLGVERFVLDDGWFCGRRSDKTSLGDWTPDPARFPDGLAPLIAHVEALGMDFGLWVEPEMVSPDSALYRAHPDWVLHVPERARPTQRHQLVLDLTREEVRAHVFDAVDALLRNNRIAYLKWDHNRELFPAQSGGQPAARRQTLGFYQILDRLRAAHPDVEIESCASGGGRIDFGVLPRVTRFWTSDNTDAIERLRIQSDASLLMPLERLGSHVGASPNPSTGRRLSMLMRARVALFSHMGLEADPLSLEPGEAEVLRQHFALYKEHRALLHSGAFHSYTGDDEAVRIWFCVAAEGTEALGLAARVGQAGPLVSKPVLLFGLADEARYGVNLLKPWPEPARFGLGAVEAWRGAPVFSGESLRKIGMRLPLTHPETAWLFHVRRQDGDGV
jgi:alpha-galactosidase